MTDKDTPGRRAWDMQREALGGFIRSQRKLADLSLRQLSELTEVSNAYLSQVERGLHAPSLRVLRSIAEALGVSAETLLAQAGMSDEDSSTTVSVEAAIQADKKLSPEQRTALISVYRSYLGDA